MSSKKFEQLLDDFEDGINERYSLCLKKMRNTKAYKELKLNYNIAYNNLIKKCGIEDVENYANSIYEINSLENRFFYLQGFRDGIISNENLMSTNKKS